MKHPLPPGLESLPRPQFLALERYARLLAARAVPLGLVAAGDRDHIWERHILDSLRAVPCLPSVGVDVFDLGSGAGLPGIPVAILRPDCRVRLVEPKSRRAAFLELAVEDLGLDNVEVRVSTAEEADGPADVCLARALAGPEASWGRAEPLLRPHGCLLYWAGRSWSERRRPPDDLRIRAQVCSPASFIWQGPVVKMARGTAVDGRT